MKRCPKCQRTYPDETLNFCLDDGEWLVWESNEPETAILHEPDAPNDAPTRAQIHTTDRTAIFPTEGKATSKRSLSDGRTSRPWSNRYKLPAIAGLAALIAVGGFFGYKYLASDGEQIDSIAVLPLENRSDDPDTDYLSDGLAESLIFRLSQLPGLRVSPTSSAIRYKGKETDIEKVGRELGVDAVLTGRLMKRGDNLNIMVELVDVRDNKSLWGEQYQRKMSDLLATQREIAATIADKLQLKLVGEQATGITKKYTNSNEAYNLWMRARHHFAKRTKTDMLRAADYYQQAIALDPKFALAYARLAEVYLNLPTYSYMAPHEALPKARSALQKALELDPTLSEAHAFNGFYLAGYEHKWAEAETEFKRAIEMDPKSSAAHFRYGQMYLLPTGQFERSIEEMKIALDMEPFDIVFGDTHAWAYFAAGQNDRALELTKKFYDLEPNHPSGRYFAAKVYNGIGMHSEALEICERALELDSNDERMISQAGVAYVRSGRLDRAHEMAMRLEDLGKTQFVSPYGQAAVQVALGDQNKAFALLEKSFQVQDWWLYRLKVDPQFVPLRDDPRYTDLLKRLDLPE